MKIYGNKLVDSGPEDAKAGVNAFLISKFKAKTYDIHKNDNSIKAIKTVKNRLMIKGGK